MSRIEIETGTMADMVSPSVTPAVGQRHAAAVAFEDSGARLHRPRDWERFRLVRCIDREMGLSDPALSLQGYKRARSLWLRLRHEDNPVALVCHDESFHDWGLVVRCARRSWGLATRSNPGFALREALISSAAAEGLSRSEKDFMGRKTDGAIALAKAALANAYRNTDIGAAKPCRDKALMAALRSDNQTIEARALYASSLLYLEERRYTEATQAAEQSLAMSRATGDSRMLAEVALLLSDIHFLSNATRKAIDILDTHAQSWGRFPQLEAFATFNKARYLIDDGDVQEGLSLLGTAPPTILDGINLTRWYWMRAEAFRKLDRFEEAWRDYQGVEGLLDKADDVNNLLMVRLDMLDTLLERGHFAEALAAVGPLCRSLEIQGFSADALSCLMKATTSIAKGRDEARAKVRGLKVDLAPGIVRR